MQTVSSGEGYLGDIFGTDLDLMIPRAEINLGEHLSSHYLIKQEVNAGWWILVFDGDDIKRSIIHT
jgi:hypothetical protein